MCINACFIISSKWVKPGTSIFIRIKINVVFLHLMATRPTFSVKIFYAAGQMGWSLGSFGVANLLIYYYFPSAAQEGKSPFPSYIYQGAILGVFTLTGLVAFSSRLIDAFLCPFVASWSDRRRQNTGRR